MKALFIILALAFGPAWADGVPLITPGPALSASDPAIQRASLEPTFVKAHPVVFNKNAFGANVITVVLNGKEHSFAGRLNLKPAPGKVKQLDISTWVGTEGSLLGGTLVISRDAASGYVSALMSIDGRVFEIKPLGSSYVMIESDPAFRRAPVTGPVIAASGVGK